MKRTIGRMAMVLLCCAGFVAAAGAQDTPPQGGGRGMMDPARRAEMMQKQLGLSDDQTTQVKAVLTADSDKMKAARDSGGSQEDMRAQMMAIRKDEQDKLKTILTADQWTKYQAMMEQMRGRMGGGGGNPPPPPPQQ